MTNYETVIGLEIHAELSTKSKIYCSCSAEFGAEENTNCCPVCTGMPGTLPVLNKSVVDYCIKAGLATNCDITKYSKQDRKNYFYPDLPKAYQVSQFDLPICHGGYVDIEVDGVQKRIGITRIHIEEDAGKLMHDGFGAGSQVDYNRCGVPLIEIVTEPDMRSPEEARIFFETLRNILMYTGVSDCKMQEGSLRCDVNVSVRPTGQEELGIRTEMKNMNSFKAAVKAMEYEKIRQIDVIENGGKVVQQTLRWDELKGRTIPLRSKEEAQDYRYFPEPDLMPIVIDDDWIVKIKSTLPELPIAKKERYINELGLPEYDARILTASKSLAEFLDGAVSEGADAKTVSNWLMGDISSYLNRNEMTSDDICFTPKNLAKLIELIDKGVISNTIGKKVLAIMFEENKDPETIINEKGMVQINDEDALATIVKEVIDANPQSIVDYKAGKDRALGFLMGQVMKVSKGKANPQAVNKMIKDILDSI